MESPSAPVGAPISEADREQLTHVFALAVSRGSIPIEFAPLIRRVARGARERGVEPERLLVALKQSWATTPEIASSRDPDRMRELLQQVISSAIERYYVPGPDRTA